MKKVSSIFFATALSISIILMITYTIFIYNSERQFSIYYKNQLNNYGSLIRKTVSLADRYTDVNSQLMDESLYHKLYIMNEELKNVPLENLNDSLLQKYKDKYDFFGLAIFYKDEQDIKIYNSSDKQEVGISTRDWGYWNEAFMQLFDKKIPSVGKGFGRENFWVGPRSRSYYHEGYYKYAYFYNENQNYIINAFVEDANSYNNNIENLLEDVFTYLKTDADYIEYASLIDLSAWEKAVNNNYKNLEDPAFIYGDFDKQLLIDSKITPAQLYQIYDRKSFNVSYNGQKKTLYFIPIGNNKDHMVVISIKDTQKNSFEKSSRIYFVLMALASIAAVIAAVTYIMSKYKAMLTFQIERNRAIEEFTQNIASLPEFIYKCRVDKDGELLLTYNDGKSVDYDRSISLEKDYRRMKEIYPSEYVDELRTKIEPALNGESHKFEIKYSGEIYEHFVSPIVCNGEHNYTEVIGLATNITDKRVMEERSRYQASYDALTGLKNRMALEEYLKLTTSKPARDTKYSFMFLDLDGFKQVNDSFGHIHGDYVLKEVAKRIEKAFSSANGILARLGGDEFAIFISYHDIRDIKKLAEAIIYEISLPFEAEDNTIRIGISIGISTYPIDSVDPKELIHLADKAMYMAKKGEGLKYRFYEKSVK